MKIEKNYLNKSESAAYLNITTKKLEKIKCQGFLKEFILGRLIYYRRRDLRYFLKYQSERVK
jgi:hypothetical protein